MNVAAEALDPAPDRRHPGGRPPHTNVHRPDHCPDKHPGSIRLAGRYATSCPHFERVRWRCVPAEESIKPHRFTTILPARHPRPSHPHSGENCPYCEHTYAPHEGPRTARGFRLSIAEAAGVLINVGQGESLRDASAHARLAALRLWPGWVAPARPAMRGKKRPRTIRTEEATAEPFSIEALLAEHPPHDPTPPPELVIPDITYETFEPEPWRVPMPDPTAPGTLPRTLREFIGDDLDELEAGQELRAAQEEALDSIWIPDLDEPLPTMKPPKLPPLDRFGFGVLPRRLARLGLSGEPEPLDYQPEEMERRDWTTRPWGHLTGRFAGFDDEDDGDGAPTGPEGDPFLGETIAGVSRQPILACDYLDLFGWTVLGPLMPTAWPEVVAIDSLPVRRGKWIEGRRIARGQKTGEIVAVVDATNQFRQVPIVVCLLGGKDRWSWLELFARMSGSPRWVVTDRDAGLAAAIAKAWPDAVHYNCEGHLLRNMRKAAIEDGQPEGSLQARNPVWVAMDKAQRRPDRWDEFVAAVEKHVPEHKTALRSWIARNEDLVLSQMALRARNRRMVRGTAAAESVLAHTGRVLGRRAGLFRNRRRLDIVLGLICAQLAHKASPIEYAGRIRTFVEERGGWTGMTRKTWPQWRDRWTGHSSIDTMLRHADLRAALETDEESREDQREKRGRMRLARDEARAVEGLPPVRPAPAGKGSRATYRADRREARKTMVWAGRKLADFPDILAQWHPTANGEIKAAEVGAGSNMRRHWLCRAHEAGGERFPGHLHEWAAAVNNRTRDGARCPYCTRKKVCLGNAITATDPKMVADWHKTRNEQGPESYLAGSNVVVWWRCKNHGDYEQPIKEHRRSGCVPCGEERRREAYLEASWAIPVFIVYYSGKIVGSILARLASKFGPVSSVVSGLVWAALFLVAAVAVELRSLLGDGRFWLAPNPATLLDEILAWAVPVSIVLGLLLVGRLRTKRP